jgi:hypothetical protein
VGPLTQRAWLASQPSDGLATEENRMRGDYNNPRDRDVDYSRALREGEERERVFEDVLLHAKVAGRGIATEEFMTKPVSGGELRWLRCEQPQASDGYYFIDVSSDICFLLPVDHVKDIAFTFAFTGVPKGSLRGVNWFDGLGGISIRTIHAFDEVKRQFRKIPTQDGPCRRPPTEEERWKFDFELSRAHCKPSSVGEFILSRPTGQQAIRFEHKAALKTDEHEHHAFVERELLRDDRWSPSGVDHTEAELFAIEWREELWVIFKTECLRRLCDMVQQEAQGGELVFGGFKNTARGVKLSLPDVLGGLHQALRH